MPKVKPFEKNADRYEEWFLENVFAYVSEVKAVKALLPPKGEGMEIGVGTGRFAAPLGIRLGVEPSKAMGKVAQKRGIDVIEGVAEALPFEDSRFDFALMVTALCFLDDMEISLKEGYRVLKPGGFLLVGFVDRESPLGKVYQKRKKDSLFYKEANFYSADEVTSFMKKAGFQDFAFTQTIFHDLDQMNEADPVKKGRGEGSFVVIRGRK
jgi:SAM-dependent methyltransferase